MTLSLQYWPQLTWLGLTLVGAGAVLASKKDWSDKTGSLLATALVGWILYMGGFFSRVCS